METPQHPILIDAIQNRLQVRFRYRSENSVEEDSSRERIVEPWIYGIKNGKESLYGFQIEGGNPGLKRFDMRRVKSVHLTGDPIENHPVAEAHVTKWDTTFADFHSKRTSDISHSTPDADDLGSSRAA